MQIEILLKARDTGEIRPIKDLPIPGVKESGASDFDGSKTWDLVLRVNEEVREELMADPNRTGIDRWCDLVDMIRDDGGRLEEVDPARGVFLTEAPMLGQYAAIEDDDSYRIDGCLWHYGDYQIEDPVEVLCREGEVTLEFGGYFDNEKFPPLGGEEYSQRSYRNFKNCIPGMKS